MYVRNLLNEKILFASVHLSDFVCNTDLMTKNILFFIPITSDFASAAQTWQRLALYAKYAIHCCCASFTKRHPSFGQKDMIYHPEIHNKMLLHAHFYNLITENQKMIGLLWSSKHSVLSNLLLEVRS